MQRIRNKSLQRKYINTSAITFNIKTTNFLSNISLFNYFSLVSYKYYLARRANNVL